MTIIFIIIGIIVLLAIIRMIVWALNPVVVVDSGEDAYLDVSTGIIAGSVVGAVVAEEIIAHSAPHVVEVEVVAPIMAADYVDAEVISGAEIDVSTNE